MISLPPPLPSSLVSLRQLYRRRVRRSSRDDDAREEDDDDDPDGDVQVFVRASGLFLVHREACARQSMPTC